MSSGAETGKIPISVSSEASTLSLSNFAALRKVHLDLKELSTVKALTPDEKAERIRKFRTDARGVGAVLFDPGERRAAQGILDFWGAELAGNPHAKEADLVPIMLAPPDTRQPFGRRDDPTTAGAALVPSSEADDQRSLIRLSAMARQWRDSGEQPGYLLTGETIKEAARYKDQDANLLRFIEHSHLAVERARERRKRTIRWVVAFTFGTSIAASLIWSWYSIYYGRVVVNYLIRAATTASDLSTALRVADWFQPLHPPFDFSGTSRIDDVSIPKLRLYAPNFTGVSFSNVKFPGATLIAASFRGASLSFDGGPGNDFSAAELRQVQFRGARISNTSFANADLYLASFDRALLCDVDFTGANLRDASFWGVTLDGTTKGNLKQTAWWLALGWPWERILEFGQGSANSKKEDESLRNRLKQSKGFKDDIQRPIDDIRGSSAGTPELAVALNNFAWTDAVWGIDVATGDAEANVAIDANSCGSNSLPANAIQASLRAICIANRLNRNGELKVFLSNLRDTQAYLYLQNGDAAKALETYALIANDDPTSLENPETSFRYAVALYAGGKDSDKAAAVDRFRTAVGSGRYQPTHELHTLRDHIFPVKEFVEALKASTNKLWPPVENLTACPAPHRGSATK